MPDSILGTIMVQAGGSAAIGGGSLPSSYSGVDREADKNVKLQEGMRKHLWEIEKASRNQPKMMTKIFKSLGVQVSLAGILKQSQIFTGVLGSIFQIFGAMVDVLLAPFVKPILVPLVKKLASWVPKLQKWAAINMPKVIEFFKRVFFFMGQVLKFLDNPFGMLWAGLRKITGGGGGGSKKGESGLSGHVAAGGMGGGSGDGLGVVEAVLLSTLAIAGGPKLVSKATKTVTDIIQTGAKAIGNAIPDHLREQGRNIRDTAKKNIRAVQDEIDRMTYDDIDEQSSRRAAEARKNAPPPEKPGKTMKGTDPLGGRVGAWATGGGPGRAFVGRGGPGRIFVGGTADKPFVPGEKVRYGTDLDIKSGTNDLSARANAARRTQQFASDDLMDRADRVTDFDSIDNKKSLRAKLPDELRKVAQFLNNAIKNPTKNAITKAKSMLAALGTKIDQVPGARTAMKGALTSLKFVANWVLTPAVMAYQAGETMYDINSIAQSSMPTFMNKLSGQGILKTGQNILNQASELLSFTDLQGEAMAAIYGKKRDRQPFQLSSLEGHKGLFEDTKLLNMLVRGTTGTIGTLLEAAPLVGQILGPVLYEWGRAKTVGSNIPFTDMKLGGGLEEYGIEHGSKGAFDAALIDLIQQLGQSKTVIQLKETFGNQNSAGYALAH